MSKYLDTSKSPMTSLGRLQRMKMRTIMKHILANMISLDLLKNNTFLFYIIMEKNYLWFLAISAILDLGILELILKLRKMRRMRGKTMVVSTGWKI